MQLFFFRIAKGCMLFWPLVYIFEVAQGLRRTKNGRVLAISSLSYEFWVLNPA
jgi:hypothetical protein